LASGDQADLHPWISGEEGFWSLRTRDALSVAYADIHYMRRFQMDLLFTACSKPGGGKQRDRKWDSVEPTFKGPGRRRAALDLRE
jgi:hypothetical protein